MSHKVVQVVQSPAERFWARSELRPGGRLAICDHMFGLLALTAETWLDPLTTSYPARPLLEAPLTSHHDAPQSLHMADRRHTSDGQQDALTAGTRAAMTADIEAELRAGRWRNGASHQAIADRYGCSPEDVGRLMVRVRARIDRQEDAGAAEGAGGSARGALSGWPVAPGHPELRSAMDPDDRRWD